MVSLLLACGCSRSSLGDLLTNGGGGSSGSAGSGGTGNGATAGFAGNGARAGSAGGAGRGGNGGSGGNGGAGGNSGGTGALGPGGNGGSGNCERDGDCPSSDSCNLGRCSEGVCTTRFRDLDGDGAVDENCGGLDCNDLNALAHPGAKEICGNGADDDCNGVTDCFDPACAGMPNCACVPTGMESCTNGIDDDCDGALDCNDPDCSGATACCNPNDAENCGNGIDDDCDGATDCMDAECAAAADCACHGFENCTNQVDDNCDGLVDCADPMCATSPSCVCKPPGTAENCNNGNDDDCDGLADCADPNCSTSPFCQHCTTEICDNGKDDDCDGAIDCTDSNCRFATNCTATAEQCNNNKDDDRDGLTDCHDPDCASNPACIATHATCTSALLITASGTYTGTTFGGVGENTGTCGGAAPEAIFRLQLTEPGSVSLDTRGSAFDTAMYVRLGSCGKGREIGCDDDNGGQGHSSALTFGTLQPGNYFIFVDGFTVDPFRGPDEGNYVLNVNLNSRPMELCENRVDDDGDGYVDCADSDCLADPKCKGCNGGKNPVPELGIAACTNGIDDDCDGTIDCADSDCSFSKEYPTECCDGIDQNGNDIPDDFSCRCVTAADCPANQLCYSHTNGGCGDPCENFFGDICPFAAPGSTCNMASQQCEF